MMLQALGVAVPEQPGPSPKKTALGSPSKGRPFASPLKGAAGAPLSPSGRRGAMPPAGPDGHAAAGDGVEAAPSPARRRQQEPLPEPLALLERFYGETLWGRRGDDEWVAERVGRTAAAPCLVQGAACIRARHCTAWRPDRAVSAVRGSGARAMCITARSATLVPAAKL